MTVAEKLQAEEQAKLYAWEEIFVAKAELLYPAAVDAAHDILHIRRVVKAAKIIAAHEKADLWVVIPAAYLHDFVNVPKNDPRRSQASRLSAEAAVEYLRGIGYPAEYFDRIAHAIAAHSFSANITPETIEAKVVQDADRLDSLGAIGIARCFSTNARLGTSFYCHGDISAATRTVDDGKYAIDHFYAKLLKLPTMMQTAAGKAEAERRVIFMRQFLDELTVEAA